MPSHRTRAQERADEIDISPTKLLADIEALQGELATASTAADEYLVALQRERAEFLNFKRRTAEERQRDLGLAAEDLIRKVLALADDFDLAIEKRPDTVAADPWFEGVGAIDRKLRTLLESEGVSVIDAARARRSIRASTTRSPTSPARAGPRARSSSRSGAAIGCATASCARPSWPSPAAMPAPTTTDRPN